MFLATASIVLSRIDGARVTLSSPILPCATQQSYAVASLDKCLAQYHKSSTRNSSTPTAKLQWTACASSPIFQSQLGLTNQLSNNATPAAFVLPASAADVAAAVRCAQNSGLPFSIRGGGHSYVAANLIEGGVVIGMQVRCLLRTWVIAWACMGASYASCHAGMKSDHAPY